MTVSASASGAFIYAAGENCADMLYATGLMTPDPFLWFSIPGLTAAVLSPLEVGRARKQARPGVMILSESELRREFALPEGLRLTPENILLALGRARGVAQWTVPASTPFGLVAKLAAAGVNVTPSESFFPERVRKRDDEVEKIREGVRLAELGLARAVEILRAAVILPDRRLEWGGRAVTAELLRGEIAAAIALAGGTSAHTIAAPGVQGADPHQVGEGPVRAGEPVVLDIFPRVDRTGYFGDLTRTVVKGTAPEVVRRAWEAVRAAQAAGAACIRAGVSGKEPFLAAAAVLEKAGFATDMKADPPRGFIHSLGHGLGLEIHEWPRLSLPAAAPLETGMVVTVEPGVYYPEWGGVRLEDVVVVAEDGCRNLTAAPFELEIP